MFAGETVRVEGTIAELDESRAVVELTATILESTFGPERPAAKPARAVVLLGTPDGPGVS
ncbi:hypothetical protein [Aeromicrobium sp. UC242_57]|uniref:hypothetical protein n=1 Tax=Aeromicrobium sp. UC242_57 TaxID=3374624 RepID=UPI0037A68811